MESTAGSAEAQVFAAASASEATKEEQIDAANAVLAKALEDELLARELEQSPCFFELANLARLAKTLTARESVPYYPSPHLTDFEIIINFSLVQLHVAIFYAT